MIKIRVETANGEQQEIRLISDYREVTHSQYIDFMYAKGRYSEAVVSIDPTQDGATAMAEALSFVTEGDISNIPFMLPEDDLEAGTLPPLQEGISLLRMFFFAESVLMAYSPEDRKQELLAEDYAYTHKGKKRVLTQKRATRAIAKRGMTTMEVIETNALYHTLNQLLKVKSDKYGERHFEADLKMLAILLRPEGEALPLRMKERNEYIEQNARELSDVPNYVIKDVSFFLTRTCKALEVSVSTPLFLMAHRNLISHQEINKMMVEMIKKHIGSNTLSSLVNTWGPGGYTGK
jgi:hypothetical protein